MPNPAQIRDSRIKRLIFITEVYLKNGCSKNLLFDKIERAGFRLWPTIRSKTVREYTITAFNIVLSRTQTEPVFPEVVEAITPYEGV